MGDFTDDLDDLDGLGPVKPPLWKNPAVLIGLLVVLAGGGFYSWKLANPTAEDLVRAGNISLSQRDADLAAQRFRRALTLDPANRANRDAHMGLSRAAELKADPKGQAEWLEKALEIWGGTASDRRALSRTLEKHYLKRAKALDSRDPEGYEKALSAAVRHEPTSEANAPLGSYLISTGGVLAGKGDHKGAVANLERVAGLRVRSKVKRQAFQMEVESRFQLFLPGFAKEFAEKHQADLLKRKLYDTKNQGFYVKTLTQIPIERGTKPNLHSVRVRNQANKDVRDELVKILAEIAGAPAEKLKKLPPSIAAWEQRTWSEGWIRFPTKFALGVVLSYNEAAKIIFLMREADKLVRKDAG
jgi:tetratricopeptide (TPR) repeat protein